MAPDSFTWQSLEDLLHDVGASQEQTAITVQPYSKNQKRAAILVPSSKPKPTRKHNPHRDDEQQYSDSQLQSAVGVLRASGTLLLTLEDVVKHLDFLDSALAEWHVARGLPQKLAEQKDLISMTRAHREEGMANYYHEHALIGLTANGYVTAMLIP